MALCEAAHSLWPAPFNTVAPATVEFRFTTAKRPNSISGGQYRLQVEHGVTDQVWGVGSGALAWIELAAGDLAPSSELGQGT